MADPIETSEVLAFAKTVEAKSLSRAAAELGVPRATISRRLARLEGRLGARLLRRSTRSLALTDAGEAFYHQARAVLEAVGQAEASVRKTDDVVRGPLRASLPPMVDPRLFAAIGAFAARYPEVQLQLSFSTAYVDLRRGGYDLALRASPALEPGLVARKLARMPIVAVASPAYLAANGTPRAASDLRRHRCLMGFARGELPETHWPLAGGGKIHVQGALFSNDIAFLCDAAERGLGVAVLPMLILAPALQSGRLVQVLAGKVGGESQLAIVYAEREFLPAQVKAFIAAIAGWAAEAFPERRARRK